MCDPTDLVKLAIQIPAAPWSEKQANGDMLAFMAWKATGLSDEEADRKAGDSLDVPKLTQEQRKAVFDKFTRRLQRTSDDTEKHAIQIPACWQPRPMIDIQKMILKPHPKLTTPLGASIKAHDSAQAEAAAKAKPEAQAGTGTSVGPGNSPEHPPDHLVLEI